MSPAPRGFLTAAFPGCGGRFVSSPATFVVDELPAYLPNGEGEHLFLHIEKTDLTTPEAAKRLARHLGVAEREVSWAGMKDRHARTRQWLSVPSKAEGKLAGFADPNLTVLEAKRHKNKLKTGHLEANRFTLTLEGVTAVDAAHACFQALAAQGLPNFFGSQRFGREGDNARKGRAVLLGTHRAKDRFEKKLLLSALQSQLFNLVLEARLASGALAQAQQGDVLKKHQTGGEFVCEDASVDQPRVEAQELSPTGPLFGPEMRQPSGAPAQAEAAALAQAQLTTEDFARGGDDTRGARRLLRVLLMEPAFEAQGDRVTLRFTLPSGAYATEVVRELLKEQAPA